MNTLKIYYDQSCENPLEYCEGITLRTDFYNLDSGPDIVELWDKVWQGKDTRARRLLRRWAKARSDMDIEYYMKRYDMVLSDLTLYDLFYDLDSDKGAQWEVWQVLEECYKDLNLQAVYKYEHGQVAYSTGNFSCPWDSGQVGFIVSFDSIDFQDSIAKSFSSWANGECYGYVIEDSDGEHVDSCWGFVGSDFASNGMGDYIGGAFSPGDIENAFMVVSL